jgi:NAD(P)H-hydrate epimerase
MRSGVGKLTVHIPKKNNDIMQVALPEAILNHDGDDKRWTCSPFESCLPNKYSAIGIGPGIGREEKTAEALYKTLLELNFTEVPLVLDADALNILAEHPQWADLIPNDTIITPHPLEYRRLVESGVCLDNAILVLKGHPTTITIPGNPSVKYECPYGNNGMGTAGSGDVLTGIILAMLSQGLCAYDAARTGAYLLGASADHAVHSLSERALLVRDVIGMLPSLVKDL